MQTNLLFQILACLALGSIMGANLMGGEPTNAKEAAAKSKSGD